MGYKLVIVGASGLAGSELLKVMQNTSLPIDNLRLAASEKSVGKMLHFKERKIRIEPLNEDLFKEADAIFLAAGSKISKAWAETAAKHGLVIDFSSAFRMHQNVPLIIPEINAHTLKKFSRSLIASPNCTTTIMLMPLYNLHRKYKIKRIVASTYQAASGGGYKLINKLLKETASLLNNEKISNPYAFNVFLHNTPLNNDRYSEEEVKMKNETRKILEDETIQVSATCVRVPILRSHSISMNVQFENDFSLDDVYQILEKTEGVTILEDYQKEKFPTPYDANEKYTTFVGRIRRDLSQEKTLEMWAVGDQLLKGAALNAWQILEKIHEMTIVQNIK